MYQPQPINLPGAYYGPPIPAQPYAAAQLPSRRRACFRLVIRILFVVCTVLFITFVTICLIFRPHRIEISVDGAALSRFNLTSPTLLSYNLSNNLSIRNPNSRIGLHYDTIKATASYDGIKLGIHQLPSFYQGKQNTTVLGFVLEGTGLGSFNVTRFNRDNRTRAFGVYVSLSGHVRYRFGSVTMARRYKMNVQCKLKVPLVSNGTVTEFQRTECYASKF